nr:MAG TPA: hypothetical protein [Caudoviricetes sp.]
MKLPLKRNTIQQLLQLLLIVFINFILDIPS